VCDTGSGVYVVHMFLERVSSFTLGPLCTMSDFSIMSFLLSRLTPVSCTVLVLRAGITSSGHSLL
jgi:hypothetical protein